NLSSEVVFRDTIPGIRYSDTVSASIPIVPARDKGLNKFTITIDADNNVDELFETNNSITKDVFIFEDEIRPVYPYNFAIINKQNIRLFASTANAFSSLKSYSMEMDTTELFNSSFKITKNVNSTGGLVEFNPSITFTDSTVYYWRVASIPSSGPITWNSSSFIYLPTSDLGYNQSHFFQHLKSDGDRISMDSVSRSWKFNPKSNNIFVRNGIYPTTSGNGSYYSGTINDQEGFIAPGCYYNEIMINVINPVTFKAWKNNYSGSLGLYQSIRAICAGGREYNFQYFLSDTLWRKRAMNFIDAIPDGYFVVVRSNTNPNTAGNTYPSVWKDDVNFFGPNNSLYHKLVNQGFADLDSINKPRSWIFIFKKNRQNEFAPESIFSEGIYDGITLNADYVSIDTIGFITSPVFGPAKSWKQLKWRGSSLDVSVGDNPTINIIGIDSTGAADTLFSDIGFNDQNFDISGINAAKYPFIKLRMRNIDTLNYTPYQLRYWRVTYLPAPEGAVAPNIFLQMKDTLEIGEPLNFSLAFKNISEAAFDSLKVKIIITDQNNVAHLIILQKQKPLVAGDTIHVSYQIDTRSFSGTNTLYVDVNPDNDQPEQYHFNNFIYRNFTIGIDSLNPLLDVTFDGVHILNRDLVSSKPHIMVKLKDEAKYLVLDDTSLVTVQVRYPNGSTRQFHFNSDTLKFTPAGQAPNPDNTATIDFNPSFLLDGDYELIVTGKDKTGNRAGAVNYRVAFQVIN
ncbi:MAG: hypothetical protein M3O67_01155, partial [Bacteroidota bacterium]|nr:hypothetical protein [Bacteroidota bacterium]